MTRTRLMWVVIAMAVVAYAGAPLAAQGGDKVKGAKVYTDAKCAACHKLGDTGGKMGPDLTKVGATRDAAWLAKFLVKPKDVDPKYKMPPVKVKGEDLDNLIAYLVSLK